MPLAYGAVHRDWRSLPFGTSRYLLNAEDGPGHILIRLLHRPGARGELDARDRRIVIIVPALRELIGCGLRRRRDVTTSRVRRR